MAEEVTKEMCDICCRPKSRHIGRDLQCPETVYFRSMPATTAQAEIAALRAERDDAAQGFAQAKERIIELEGDKIALRAEVERKDAALKPFADCCNQIDDSEDDEEWAKFRLLVKEYRAARAALSEGTQP